MAGSEKSGFEARSPILFESALWILTDTQDSVSSKAPLLLKCLNKVKSKIFFLDSKIHDQFIAQVSHLPQYICIVQFEEACDSLVHDY